MDILLHLTGLVFIPLMAYMLFMGMRDIFSEIHLQFMPRKTIQGLHKISYEIPQIYEFTAQSIIIPIVLKNQTRPFHN